MKKATLVVGISVLLILGTGMGFAHGPEGVHEKQTETVRDATAEYRTDISEAREAGYGGELHCVPGMGYHLANFDLVLDGDVNPRTPEVLVYAENSSTNELELVGVEYLVVGEYELWGHDFHEFAPLPNGEQLYALHAWVWLDNEDGMFNDTNSKVKEDCTF